MSAAVPSFAALTALPRAELLRLSLEIDAELAMRDAVIAVAGLPGFTKAGGVRRAWVPAEDVALCRAWLASGCVTRAARDAGLPRDHALRRLQQLMADRDRVWLRREGKAVLAALEARARRSGGCG